MTHRSFVIWLVLAMVTFAVALISVFSQPGFQQAGNHDEVVFPELRADPNAAAKLAITAAGSEITLLRNDDGGWRVEDKSGYPADGKKVVGLIAALADTRFVEAKTALPESFSRLEVEDPTGESAKSRRITISSADDKVLTDLILGKRSTQRTSRDAFGSYLRRPDQQQAWLVNQEIQADRKIEDWLAREILNIAQGEIAAIEITPAESEGYSLSRAEAEADFVLADAPEATARADDGAEEKTLDQGAVERIASALYFLNLRDVHPRKGFQMPEARSIARLTTFDGLGVLVEVASLDDKHWASFTVGYTGEDAADTESAKAVKAKAEKLNTKVMPWVFEISKFEADRLRQSLDELLTKRDQGE